MKLLIAGVEVALYEPEAVLAELEPIYRQFTARAGDYARDRANPHLCFAGCSHCCRSGAFFAVTLVEALRWAHAVAGLEPAHEASVRAGAAILLETQRRLFEDGHEPRDRPGERPDEVFRRRVARVASIGAACPLLEADLCSVYEGRPFLCRAYGYPVDAFAVERDDSITFRSLCHLYADKTLLGYVQARDSRRQLADLSRRLAGGIDLGRFTSAEAILAVAD